MSDEETKQLSDTGGSEQPKPAPRMYTEDEVNARLRGAGKQIEELQTYRSELESLKAKQAEADKKAAEERGEYQKLYESKDKEFAELSQKHESESMKAKAFEEMIKQEVTSKVEGIKDKEFRQRVESVLNGRDILDQKQILEVMLMGAPVEVRPQEGGPPGRPKKGESKIDVSRFASDQEYRIQQALAAMKEE